MLRVDRYRSVSVIQLRLKPLPKRSISKISRRRMRSLLPRAVAALALAASAVAVNNDYWVDRTLDAQGAGSLFYGDGREGTNSYVTRTADHYGWERFEPVMKETCQWVYSRERLRDQMDRYAKDMSRDYSTSEFATRTDLHGIAGEWEDVDRVPSLASAKTVALVVDAGGATQDLSAGPVQRLMGRDCSTFLVALSTAGAVAHFSIPGFDVAIEEGYVPACFWGAFLFFAAMLGIYAWKKAGLAWKVYKNLIGWTVLNAVMRGNLCYFKAVGVASFALMQTLSDFYPRYWRHIKVFEETGLKDRRLPKERSAKKLDKSRDDKKEGVHDCVDIKNVRSDD